MVTYNRMVSLVSSNKLIPATSYPAILGKTIVELREKIGIDQKTFAQRMGLTPSTWSKIERGISALSIDQLALVGKALGIKPSVIVETADEAADELRRKGVQVTDTRINNEDNTGLVLIGVAAIGLAIAAILSKK